MPDGPEDATPLQAARLEVLRRLWEYPGADVDRAGEIYHDDAVLEFPQSGERFEGVAGFTAWMLGVQLLEFRGERVARERIYVMEGWEAPEWRAPWRSATPADPPVERP